MFEFNSEDFQSLFNDAGRPVLINDVQRYAIITNPPLSEYEERYLHTLETVSQGDIVALDDEKYLVITETISKRSAKYKALMRHCNCIIEFPTYKREIIGYNDFGEPFFKDVLVGSDLIHSIVDNKSFSVEKSAQIRVPNNQLTVIVQNNELTIKKFKQNAEFTTLNKKLKVLHVDLTKTGLLILTCETV